VLSDLVVPAGPNVLKGRNPELPGEWVRANIVVPEGGSVTYTIDFTSANPAFTRVVN
jgi:hypothetical protein